MFNYKQEVVCFQTSIRLEKAGRDANYGFIERGKKVTFITAFFKDNLFAPEKRESARKKRKE
jgi:hypothetical protein